MTELFKGENVETLAYLITSRDNANDEIKRSDAVYPGVSSAKAHDLTQRPKSHFRIVMSSQMNWKTKNSTNNYGTIAISGIDVRAGDD